MDEQGAATTGRWDAKPALARVVRVFALLAPLVASIVFVHVASKVVPAPSGSFWLYGVWWLGLSAAATVVLVGIDRACRRLLPLAALLKLSLVFPDHAPSRFRAAMRNRSVGTLEERLAEARAGRPGETPVEAAERLLGLVADLDAHDRLTRGHSDRVRAYSQMIGEELGLSKRDVDLLNWAALLHDVGKLGVPGEILTKPGRPTDEEWEALRQHPVVGLELVEPLRTWLGEWAEAVGHHHERWDGKGYPYGLAGEDISLAGRIVAVSDVFDVITSARSYKSAAGAAEARNEIARCADTQFDPRVVRAFLSVGLGRLRFAMGPLSWLAHAPILGRIPLTPAVSAVSGTLAAATAVVATGLVEPPVRLAEPLGTRPALAATPAPAGPDVGGAQPTPPANAPGGVEVTPPAQPPAAPPAADDTPAAPKRPAANEAPQAAADAVETPEDAPVVADVLANDSDSEGDALLLTSAEAATGSAAVVDGRIRWTPPRDFHGQATVDYTVADVEGASARGRLTVTVSPLNDAPVAVDDAVLTQEDNGVAIVPLQNDADVDGDELQLESVGAPDAGRVTRSGSALLFTPPPNFAGTARFRYEAADRRGGVAGAVVTVTVRAVGDPPVARADSATVVQAAAVDVNVLANDSDADGDTLALAAVGTPSVGRAEIAGGRVRFHAPAAALGRATVTYTVADPSGATATGTLTVEVTDLNHAPSFVAGAGQSVLEDAGVVTVTGWASGISAGPADEAGQAVSFLVSSDNPSLFSSQPAVSGDGTLTFRPAPDANGTAKVTVRARDDGGTAGGGADTSEPQTFAVHVTAVNDPPSFTPGPDETHSEHAVVDPVTVPGWATAISPGPADESAQNLSFHVSAANPALFTAGGQPAVAPDGMLTYTPAPGMNGTTTVTVKAVDDGGIADGGVDRSAVLSFTITITPVNSVPAFTAGPSQSVAEDAGAQSVSGWATGISAGPADEAGQTVSFLVGSDNVALFAAQPAVAADGTLTYTPAPNAHGTATVTVRAQDDGGTADGGVDTSAPQSFTITVTSLNDAPSFAAGANQSVPEDSGSQTVAGWATGMSAGPSDESGQSIAFDVTNDANGLFATQPAVAADGTLAYTPAANANGTATVTVRARDDGGTAGGGSDTSAPQTFTITLTAVADAPVAVDDAVSMAEDSAGVTFAVLTNDTDADPGAVLSLSSFDGSTVDDGTLTHNGGGSFTYVPDSSAPGTETFSYVVSDGSLTDTGSVTITITSLPDAPTAAADGYTTTPGTNLVVPAPGLLANDADEDGDTLTVQTTPIVPPANGTLTLAADGSFTYLPDFLFVGTDSFTYRADDGTGRTADATVTITVSLTATPDTYFLQSSGTSADVWDMTPSAPPNAGSVPDWDGDGDAGLTVKKSNGDEDETDPRRYQEWTTTAPLAIDGPIRLRLNGAISLLALLDKSVHVYAYLYDCDPSLASCTMLLASDVHVNAWNGLLGGWVEHEFSLGSVTHTFGVARTLRLRLLVDHRDLWVALTGEHPSSLELTLP